MIKMPSYAVHLKFVHREHGAQGVEVSKAAYKLGQDDARASYARAMAKFVPVIGPRTVELPVGKPIKMAREESKLGKPPRQKNGSAARRTPDQIKAQCGKIIDFLKRFKKPVSAEAMALQVGMTTSEMQLPIKLGVKRIKVTGKQRATRYQLR